MFKEKKILSKTVYYSDILPVEHFFTSRELIVAENKDLIADYLNIKVSNLKHPNQVHSTNIQIAREEINEYPKTDSLIADNPNIAVYLNFADCTPVILYDIKNNIGAVAHAGWRGTALKIAPLTVQKMSELYSTNPKDVIAVIGPAISLKCFETSDEVISALSSTVKNKTGLFEGRYADLKNINRVQLAEIGVEKIDVCPYCTVLDNDKFFSYRNENKTMLRHSAVLKIM